MLFIRSPGDGFLPRTRNCGERSVRLIEEDHHVQARAHRAGVGVVGAGGGAGGGFRWRWGRKHGKHRPRILGASHLAPPRANAATANSSAAITSLCAKRAAAAGRSQLARARTEATICNV